MCDDWLWSRGAAERMSLVQQEDIAVAQPMQTRMALALLLLGATFGSCVPAQPIAREAPIRELTNRTAEAPERCVVIQPGEALRVGGPGTLLYGRGRTLWVNQLGPACAFSPHALLIIEPVGQHHCRGDLVRAVDPQGFGPPTACRLGDFVPYTR